MGDLIKIEKKSTDVWVVVDTLEKTPVERFEGPRWLCLSYVTSMLTNLPCPKA
jgi:hypothetical protein